MVGGIGGQKHNDETMQMSCFVGARRAGGMLARFATVHPPASPVNVITNDLSKQTDGVLHEQSMTIQRQSMPINAFSTTGEA